MVAMETPICNFGWKAPDFELLGVDGERHRLADLKGEKGTLVMFICQHCPYVKTVLDRIIRDARELQEHGIASVAIMPNDPTVYPEDSFENMQRVAREYDFPFSYLYDETQGVARAYDAVCTPDFFGFNADLELQYRGRLDASKTTLVPDARRELFGAMVQVARTGQGPADQIASMGCSIKWRQAA
ncbi:MAG: thioredoxin family protein [Alphaproteobacteria bacterium]